LIKTTNGFCQKKKNKEKKEKNQIGLIRKVKKKKKKRKKKREIPVRNEIMFVILTPFHRRNELMFFFISIHRD